MKRFTLRQIWLIISVAWLTFIVSFFLPATNVLVMAGPPVAAPIRGWEAAIATWGITFSAIGVALILADLRFLILWAIPIYNLAMFVAPWLAHRNPEKASRVSALLVPIILVPILLPTMLRGDFFIGFYLWGLSSILMTFGCWSLERFYATWSNDTATAKLRG